MEAGATGSSGVEAELDRVEVAVAAGDRDLKALGFWRVVGEVKRDPALVAAYADRIGLIDRTAFRAGVRLRLPVVAGNLALLGEGLAGVAALTVAGRLDEPTIVGLLVVGTGLAWTVAFHCPVHWLVGSLAGIRFTDYFLGGKPPRPGLKIDYASYLRTDPGKRAWMHASGAIGTKLAPFLALAFAPRATIPGWATAVLAVIGVGQLVTDAVFSVRSSDWKRFLRERRIARSVGG